MKPFSIRLIQKQNIRKTRWAAAFVLGLLYALSFFAFTTVFRDLMRVFNSYEFYYYWKLSPVELFWSNAFFAALSYLLGQSIAVDFLFSKSHNHSLKRNIHRLQIIHDHRFLVWMTVFVVAQFSMAILFMFGDTVSADWFVIQQQFEFKYFYLAIIFVLFLQSWNSFVQIKRQWKWKIIAGSFLLMIIFSLGLSQLKIINLEGDKYAFLRENPYDTFHIDLPETSDQDMHLYRSRRANKEPLVITHQSKPNHPDTIQVYYNNREVGLENICALFQKLRDTSQHFYYRPSIAAFIMADRDVLFRQLIAVEYQIYDADIHTIAYSVIPKRAEFPSPFYFGRVSNPISISATSVHFTNRDSINKYWAISDTVKNRIDLFTKKGRFYFRHDVPAHDQLTDTLAQMVNKQGNYILRIVFDSETRLEDYLKIKDQYFMIISKYRQAYLRNKYNKTEFYEISWEEVGDIHKKYPMRFLYRLSNE